MSSEATQLIAQNVNLTQELMKLQTQHEKDKREIETLRALVKEYRKNMSRRYERDKGRSAKLSDVAFELVMAGAAVAALQIISYVIFELWTVFKGI